MEEGLAVFVAIVISFIPISCLLLKIILLYKKKVWKNDLPWVPGTLGKQAILKGAKNDL